MTPDPFIVRKDTAAILRDIGEYPGGIVIPVDKPYRWTSADVIRKIKFTATRHFGKKNLKVGHAGTLDPLATGILIVCIGNATKIAEKLQSHEKEYIAGISFGATTPSYDLEKDVDRMFPYAHITEESVRSALGRFIGEQEQIAPLFSAKSVDGVRAYELARKLYRQNQSSRTDRFRSDGTGDPGPSVGQDMVCGEAADLDSAAKELLRTSIISIPEIELLDFRSGTCPDPATTCPPASGLRNTGQTGKTDTRTSIPEAAGETAGGRNAGSRINIADTSHLGLPHADIRIRCSKGTYIRAFARDLGEALDSGAHLDSLRRTASGPFRIEDAASLDHVLSLLSTMN